MSALATLLRFSAASEIQLASNAPLADGTAEVGFPLAHKGLGLDGANFSYATSTGSSISILIGPTNAGEYAPNGYKSAPDLSSLHGLCIRCKSTAGSAPEWTGEADTSVVVGWLADCGNPGVSQTAAANHVAAWTPAGTFLVGDFSYNMEADDAAGLEADTAVFDTEITAETLYPVPGNHEWDTADCAALLFDRFPYISAFDTPPAESGTCYDVTFKGDAGDDDPLLHVFCLDTMFDSAGAYQGSGDGLVEFGTFFDWIMGRIVDNPRARYRVAMVHFPAVTSVGYNGESDNGTKENLAFLARSGLFDLIIHGHTHSTEHLVHHGVTVLNCSSPVQTVREAGMPLSGAAAAATLLYSNSTARTVGKLTATPEGLLWQIHEVGGSVLASGTILPRAVPYGEFEVTITGLGKVSGSTAGASDPIIFSLREGDVMNNVWKNGHPIWDHASANIVATRRDYGAGTASENMANLQLEILAIGR